MDADLPTRPEVEHVSIHVESKNEADFYKFIRSRDAGYDLGEVALREWVKLHWRGFVRARLMQHLQGLRYWCELDRGDFGVLTQEFGARRPLVDEIVHRLICGDENLPVLNWAIRTGRDSTAVREILEIININDRRLQHQLFPC